MARLKMVGYKVGGAAVALMLLLAGRPAQAQRVLKIGMTAADRPITTGNPDQGSRAIVSSAKIFLTR